MWGEERVKNDTFLILRLELPLVRECKKGIIVFLGVLGQEELLFSVLCMSLVWLFCNLAGSVPEQLENESVTGGRGRGRRPSVIINFEIAFRRKLKSCKWMRRPKKDLESETETQGTPKTGEQMTCNELRSQAWGGGWNNKV